MKTWKVKNWIIIICTMMTSRTVKICGCIVFKLKKVSLEILRKYLQKNNCTKTRAGFIGFCVNKNKTTARKVLKEQQNSSIDFQWLAYKYNVFAGIGNRWHIIYLWIKIFRDLLSEIVQEKISFWSNLIRRSGTFQSLVSKALR